MVDRFKKIRFAQLLQVMEDLGYQVKPAEKNHVVFEHPGRDLFTFVRNIAPEEEVRPIDLLSVQKMLTNEGLIKNEEQFASLFFIKKGDSLIWTDPNSGRDVAVVAVSGETSDGLVFIKQKGGAFSPCPVEQLRPVGKAVVHN